jgi:hypothetical protein
MPQRLHGENTKTLCNTIVNEQDMRRGANPETEDYADGEIPEKVEITFVCHFGGISSIDPLAQRVRQGVRFRVNGKSYHLRREVNPDEIYNKSIFKPNGTPGNIDNSFKVEWDNDDAMKLWKDLKENGFEEYIPEYP